MKQLLNLDVEETRTYFLFADGWVVDRDSHEIKRCEPDLIMTRCSGMPFPEKGVQRVRGQRPDWKQFLDGVALYEKQILTCEGVAADS